jgi:hypothetical protein
MAMIFFTMLETSEHPVSSNWGKIISAICREFLGTLLGSQHYIFGSLDVAEALSN